MILKLKKSAGLEIIIYNIRNVLKEIKNLDF